MDYKFYTRDVVSEIQSAPDTFTSWDKCMSKAYCKWPVIAGIIIGGLIALSVVYCLIQCICCGASCASMLCCCCRRGGGSRSHSRPSRYKEDYNQMPPTPYQPAPASMAYQQNAPQFATFDASNNKKVHEDSLPAMPSWQTAQTRRIEEPPSDDLEMGPVSPQPRRMVRGGYNQVPAGPASPISPPFVNQNAYFNGNTPAEQYNSDLGAQKMGLSQDTGYHGFQNQSQSPAPPTYRTTAGTPSVQTDRFAAGAINPTPQDYQRGYQPSDLSTRYEDTEYAPSMNNNNNRYYQNPHQNPVSHGTTSPTGYGQRSPTYGYNQPSNQYDHPQQTSNYGGGYDQQQQYDPAPASYGYNDQREPQQQTSPLDQRPPSLLMVGRKAVPGSQREV